MELTKTKRFKDTTELLDRLNDVNADLLKLAMRNMPEFDRYDNVSKGLIDAYDLIRKQAEYIIYVENEQKKIDKIPPSEPKERDNAILSAWAKIKEKVI